MRRFLLPVAVFVWLIGVDARAADEDSAAAAEASAEQPATDSAAAAEAEAEALPTPPPEAESVETKEVEAAPVAEPAFDGADLDPAWALYEEAFRAAARGDLAESERRLLQIMEEFPDHPAASSARSVLAVVRAAPTRSRGATSRPVTDELYVEETTNLARAEIAIFQTGHGIGLGIETCLILECGEVWQWVITLFTFAGGGLGGSLAATSGGVTPGTALAINSGTSWGFWNGLALLLIVDPESPHRDKKWAGGLMAAQLLGMGGGVAASYLAQPTSGAVSMANSAGIWSAVMALWLYGMFVEELDGDAFVGTLLAASDIGLVGGALASRYFPMSRGRTLVIDAGGILGLLFGGGIVAILASADFEFTQLSGFGIMATTMAGGLVLSTYLTRNWDVPDVPLHASVIPVADPRNGKINGASAVLGFAF